MFRNYNNKKQIILKRNDKEEKNLNYKKIYDLSQIDLLQEINPEKKLALLITIKKILLCTNKYVDICNSSEIIKYCIMSGFIFLFYVLFLSPLIKIYFLTEEQTQKLEYFTIPKKFYYYSISQIIEIIFRIIFNYFRKRKSVKIFLYFARNELNKIKNDFNIEIDDNFDLTINLNKNNYFKSKEPEENENNNFFQYVICYPNVRYYNWDKKIVNEKERIISDLIKTNIQKIEDNYLLRYSFVAIIIFIIYIISFYFLTKAKLVIYFIFTIILFFFTKIMSIMLSFEMKKTLINYEEVVNKFYISQGYFTSFNTSMIEIFKLNSKYENNNININEAYNILSNQVRNINEQFYTFKS